MIDPAGPTAIRHGRPARAGRGHPLEHRVTSPRDRVSSVASRGSSRRSSVRAGSSRSSRARSQRPRSPVDRRPRHARRCGVDHQKRAPTSTPLPRRQKAAAVWRRSRAQRPAYGRRSTGSRDGLPNPRTAVDRRRRSPRASRCGQAACAACGPPSPCQRGGRERAAHRGPMGRRGAGDRRQERPGLCLAGAQGAAQRRAAGPRRACTPHARGRIRGGARSRPARRAPPRAVVGGRAARPRRRATRRGRRSACATDSTSGAGRRSRTSDTSRSRSPRSSGSRTSGSLVAGGATCSSTPSGRRPTRFRSAANSSGDWSGPR